jgi:hypothetical protein
MPYLIIILVLLAAVLGPSLWASRIMRRYSEPADRYPNSDGEVARRLLDELGPQEVGTEITEKGDHYDPEQHMVRLSQQNFEGHSLTAITIAAHEVGHAIQHASGYMPLIWRTRLVRWVSPVEKSRSSPVDGYAAHHWHYSGAGRGLVDADGRISEVGLGGGYAFADPADRIRCELWARHAVAQEAKYSGCSC